MDISKEALLKHASDTFTSYTPGASFRCHKHITDAIRNKAMEHFEGYDSDEEIIFIQNEKFFGGPGKKGFFLTEKYLYQNMNTEGGKTKIPLSEINSIDLARAGFGNKPLLVNGEEIFLFARGLKPELASFVNFCERITGVNSERNEKKGNKEQENILPRLKEIKQEIEALGATSTFGTKKEIASLPDVLSPDERIKGLTSGLLDGNTWLITCTNKRVVFLDKGMIYGLNQKEIPLDKINSISHKTGMLLGEISIWDGAAKTEIKNISKGTIKGFVDAVNNAITDAKQSNQTGVSQVAQTDVATQLEKLASLLEKGLLTEEEFKSQKVKLLG